MKLWAVHFMSESSDHYYETFRCRVKPTEEMLLKWWASSSYNDGEPAAFINIKEVFEVDPKSPELK
jgi:hypothetical protein